MNTRRDTITHSKVTFACIGLLVAMIVMYLYFLNMSVVQVVMRTDYIQQQNKLNAEITMLDASYIEAQHTIASRIANLEGYDTDTAKVFVSRQPDSLVMGNQR